jgi:hypothetical protein
VIYTVLPHGGHGGRTQNFKETVDGISAGGPGKQPQSCAPARNGGGEERKGRGNEGSCPTSGNGWAMRRPACARSAHRGPCDTPNSSLMPCTVLYQTTYLCSPSRRFPRILLTVSDRIASSRKTRACLRAAAATDTVSIYEQARSRSILNRTPKTKRGEDAGVSSVAVLKSGGQDTGGSCGSFKAGE